MRKKKIKTYHSEKNISLTNKLSVITMPQVDLI